MTVTRRLWRRLAEVDGFLEGASVFSQSDDDRAYFVNGTQVASERAGELELRLTRPVIRAHRDRLKADPRVGLRPSSDWTTVVARGPKDDGLVLELAELTAAAHRPPPGAPAKPPPTGADLARRRRFH